MTKQPRRFILSRDGNHSLRMTVDGGLIDSKGRYERWPLFLSRGDDVEMTFDEEPLTMRVWIKVLDDDERWPSTTLLRLQDWLEAHHLDRVHGLEILRIMNDQEPVTDEFRGAPWPFTNEKG